MVTLVLSGSVECGEGMVGGHGEDASETAAVAACHSAAHLVSRKLRRPMDTLLRQLA